jgi:hypothetical protein
MLPGFSNISMRLKSPRNEEGEPKKDKNQKITKRK